MERLLETAHFKNSRRYPALFRFIVEETLEGRGEFLKERLLGVRVFNRPPDYDTADDPIARVTIAEIRKRIAQYYHEEAHESEMRIELMPGRYEPEFYPRKARASPATIRSNPTTGWHLTLAPDTDTPVDLPAQKISKPWLSPLSLVGKRLLRCFLFASYPLFCGASTRPSALEQLWNPVLKPHLTITFCLPNKDASGSQIAAAAGILSYSAPTKPERRRTDSRFRRHSESHFL